MSAPTPTPLPALLATPAAARPALAAVLGPFFARGVLGLVDLHVVDQLGALGGEARPQVLLALALAVRAPRYGHVVVDLADHASLDAGDLERERERGASAEPPTPLPWPTDAAAWIAAVAASPLVRRPEETERVTPFVLAGTLLTMDRYWGYQERLAATLRARALRTLAPADPALLAQGLAVLFPGAADLGGEDATLDRQRLAAAMATLRGFTVISGGPGTGKTATIRSVLALYFAQWAARRTREGPTLLPLRVALAAPTGKAAARMKESLNARLEAFIAAATPALGGHATGDELRRFLAELVPATLHRLLGYRPDRPTRFRRDAHDPLPFDVVVVDETSMVDLPLMAKLAAAVPAEARLVLLGDQHQLASVEAGTVLADVCHGVGLGRPRLSAGFVAEVREATGFDLGPHVTVGATPGLGDCIVQLDRNYRFKDASGIGVFARRCLAAGADVGRVVAVLRPEAGYADVTLLRPEADDTLGEVARRVIREGYRGYLELLFAGPQGAPLEAHHRAVLDAFERFRVLCAHRRGRLGVEGLNALIVALLSEVVPGFEADGAFYLGRPVLVTENDYTVNRFNGDIGVVVRDAQGERTVVFPAEGGGVSTLAPARLPPHETVFAMTIHKSQGSEFAHAMVVLPARPSPILTRELVYTGVTRAAERMTLVATDAVLVAALERRVRRASGLVPELWGGAGGAQAEQGGN